jgi:hypothetical protein
MKSIVRLVLCLTFFSVASPVAFATGRLSGQTADEREKVAKKACITGDVDKGIDILADLYVESGEINFVFNQGRCFQQNHRWQEAIDRFSEFLRKARNLSAEAKAETDRYIADCQSHLSTPTSDDATPPSTATSAAAPSPTPVGILAATSSANAHPGSGLRRAGIAVGALGLAAIVTGVVLDIKANSIVNDVYSNGYDAEKLSSRDSYETWGWITYGIGAASIITGTTLYLLGASAGRAESTDRRLSVVPVVGRGGAMLVLQGGIQ